MKLIFTITFLFASILVNKILSQAKQNISIGPIFGSGHTWNNLNSSTTDRKYNPSYNVGVRFTYSFTSYLELSIDGSFRTEGVKFTNYAYHTQNISNNLNYIRLDPKAYYFFRSNKKSFMPKIGVGPSFGFLVGGNLQTSQSVEIYKAKAKDVYHFFDLGISNAIGFNYRINSRILINVDAIYNHGIIDIYKNNQSYNIGQKNRGVLLNAGVVFSIGSAASKK